VDGEFWANNRFTLTRSPLRIVAHGLSVTLETLQQTRQSLLLSEFNIG
jgi:hypothetical protein